MAIPTYEDLMLPLLKYADDQKEHFLRDAIEHLAIKSELSDEERKKLLPSGQQAIFDNRVGWARTYLKKAGLLETTKRGYFIITKKGLKTLEQNPSAITDKFLKQFPGFQEFVTKPQKVKTIKATDSKKIDEHTPDEILEDSYQRIKENLAQELLNQVKNCSPSFFEKLVVELIVKMGYGGSIRDAGKAIGKSGDGGIDGIIKEDKLGLDIISIQAKRWDKDNKVGSPEIQKFAGALQGQRAKKGIFITTSSFTKEAEDYVSKIDNKIVLIDGDRLAEFMIDYNIGVSRSATYEIKKIDLDYFTED